MNIKIILIGLGALAVFAWSKLFPKKEPIAKTGALDEPSEEPSDFFTNTFETGAAKVAAIVTGGGAAAKVATTILPKAAVLPKAVVSMLPIVGKVLIPTVALPVARVMPEAVLGMLPKPPPPLSPVATGGTTVAKTLGGFGIAISPAIIVPAIAKILDAIFPKHVVTEEEQMAMDANVAFKQLLQDQGVPTVKGYVPLDIG